jgi:hypothetical protein
MFQKPTAHPTRLLFLLLLTPILLSGCAHFKSQQFAGASLIEHSGYADCIKLENQTTTVVICPACGGRILEYSLNGRNSLYLDPKQNGWLYEPNKPAIDPSGGRFDIGPEMTIPRHPDLWLGRWTVQITGPRSARLVSAKDKATGVQLIREFTLDKFSSQLTCRQIIKNVSSETILWCHWSRTLAAGGGICLIPLTPDSRFPNNYVMYGQGPVIDYRPEDPNIVVRDDFLQILGTPKYPKLGMDSCAGWLCYLTKNDLMFIKRFPTYPDRLYNEIAAITISIWYYKDIMCELEPIGPAKKIPPGKSASFSEKWWLLPYKFPRDRKVDTAEITEIVDTHARESKAPWMAERK